MPRYVLFLFRTVDTTYFHEASLTTVTVVWDYNQSWEKRTGQKGGKPKLFDLFLRFTDFWTREGKAMMGLECWAGVRETGDPEKHTCLN